MMRLTRFSIRASWIVRAGMLLSLAYCLGCGPSKTADSGAGDEGKATVASTAKGTDDDVLQFIPPNATSVLIKRPSALDKFGVPFLVRPDDRERYVITSQFQPKEIERSAVMTVGGANAYPAIFYMRLAPGSTIQRLLNAGGYKKEASDNSDFACYRPASDDAGMLIAARGDQTCVLGVERDLKPLLAPKAVEDGPLSKRVRSLVADHDLVVGCLTEYQGLELAQSYFYPIQWVVLPEIQQEIQRLPAGSLNSVAFGLKLGGSPHVRLLVEAADESLAGEIEGLIQRGIQRVQATYKAMRDDLKQRLPEDAAADIDSFIFAAVSSASVRKNKSTVELEVAMGDGADSLKRFAELAVRRDVRFAFHLEESLREMERRGTLQTAEGRLKMVAVAVHTYHDVWKKLPAAAVRDKDGKPLLSWRVTLLPQLGHLELFEQFHMDEPWDSPHNLALLEKVPDIYRNTDGDDPTKCRIQFFTGPKLVFGPDQPIHFGYVQDGTSYTILAVEAPPERAVPWTKPEDLPLVPDDPASVLGTIPPEGFTVVMLSGEIRKLPATLRPEEWRALIDPRDGVFVQLP